MIAIVTISAGMQEGKEKINENSLLLLEISLMSSLYGTTHSLKIYKCNYMKPREQFNNFLLKSSTLCVIKRNLIVQRWWSLKTRCSANFLHWYTQGPSTQEEVMRVPWGSCSWSQMTPSQSNKLVIVPHAWDPSYIGDISRSIVILAGHFGKN